MSGMNGNFVELTANIVSAFVANNVVIKTDLPALIADVFGALTKLDGASETIEAVPLVPAVPIRKSVTSKAIICLEDGKPFKSLKRHLRAAFDMSPEQYRAKWGLPPDYPMVAPAYAEARSAMAKSLGLGRKAAIAPTKAKRMVKVT